MKDVDLAPQTVEIMGANIIGAKGENTNSTELGEYRCEY